MRSTPLDKIPKLVAACRVAHNKGLLHTVADRRAAIRKVVRMIQENETALTDATKKDLGKPAFETKLTEIGIVLHEAFNSLDNLDDWMKPEKVPLEKVQKLDPTYIKRDPLGVILIMGAWNYPLQLTLVGMVGALAGGNTVVLKPSELAPASAAIVADLLPKYLPTEMVAVVEGGVPESTALLKERFDHILYTGGPHVAKIVMAAAAQHLTPVTLELGGKSPCIVDKDADMKIAARRIMWGRMLNCGQTCIAPDYILVPNAVKSRLVAQLAEAREEFMGKDPKATPDYARMVNDRHFKRVLDLMKHGKVVVGGEHDASEKFIAPTVLDNVDLSSPLMTDEIFGPLLPLVPYETKEEAVAFIKEREKPLAMYVFTNNSAFARFFEEHTSAGGLTINDTLMHATVAGLPFGGVGSSGMGAYHGKHTFDLFTHRKAVLQKKLALEFANSIRYPPYSERKYNLMMLLAGRTGESSPLLKYAWYGVFVAVVAVVAAIARSRGML